MPGDSESIEVSVVIPTKNDEGTLDACLRSIRETDYPDEKLEILLIDGHSTDRTREIGRKYGCEILTDSGTIAEARERGVSHARGDYVAFTDADCVVTPEWLDHLLKPLRGADDVAAVGGPNITPPSSTGMEQAVGDVLKLLSKPGARYGYQADILTEVHHNPTCNALYRRDVLLDSGGFTPELITADDEELDYRIRQRGYTILYTPDAVVYHHRRSTVAGFFRMGYRYGMGRMQAIRLHREMGEWFHYVPSVSLVTLSVLLAASIVSPLMFSLAIGVLLVGGCGVLGLSLYLSVTEGSLQKLPLYAVLIGVWGCSWGLGFLFEYLRTGRPALGD